MNNDSHAEPPSTSNNVQKSLNTFKMINLGNKGEHSELRGEQAIPREPKMESKTLQNDV